MVATGYTFQGKPLRPALVRVGNGAIPEGVPVGLGVAEILPAKQTGQSHLPLEPKSEGST